MSARIALLEAEVNRVRAERDERLIKQGQEHVSQLRAVMDKNALLVQQERRRGYLDGSRDQRREGFLSPAGQLFLDQLVHGVLDGYRGTPQFSDDFSDGVVFLLKDIAAKTLDMIEATPEQREVLDMEALVDSLDGEGLDQALGIDPNIPVGSEAWVIPILDRAIKGFVDGDESMPLPARPLFRTPYLDSIHRSLYRAADAPPSFYDLPADVPADVPADAPADVPADAPASTAPTVDQGISSEQIPPERLVDIVLVPEDDLGKDSEGTGAPDQVTSLGETGSVAPEPQGPDTVSS